MHWWCTDKSLMMRWRGTDDMTTFEWKSTSNLCNALMPPFQGQYWNFKQAFPPDTTRVNVRPIYLMKEITHIGWYFLRISSKHWTTDILHLCVASANLHYVFFFCAIYFNPNRAHIYDTMFHNLHQMVLKLFLCCSRNISPCDPESAEKPEKKRKELHKNDDDIDVCC